MAVAINSQMPSRTGFFAQSLSSLSYAFNNAAGTLLIVDINIGSNDVAPTSVTYNLIDCGSADVHVTINTAARVQQFHRVNPATGSNNVAITMAANQNIFSGASSYTGNDAATPIRQTASATGNSASPSVTLTNASLPNGYIVHCLGHGSSDANDAVVGPSALAWVFDFDNFTSSDNARGAVCPTDRTAQTLSWSTPGADFWGVTAVEIQQAWSQSESASADVLLDAYGPFHAAGTAFQGNAFQENAFQVLGGSNGGPFTYNEAVDATALARDVVDSIQIHNTSVDTASALAQDALATAQAMNASLSESALAQDALATIQIMTASEAPSALAQEQLATTQVMLASEPESATAAEIFATAQIMLASLSETALAQDVALGALQIPITLSEQSLADVLFDAQVVSPAGGNTYNEEISAGALAKDSVDAGLQFGSGIEAKIGGAGTGTSIFIFDD